MLPQFLSRLAGITALALVAGPALAADFDGSYPPPRPEYGDALERRPPPPPPLARIEHVVRIAVRTFLAAYRAR